MSSRGAVLGCIVLVGALGGRAADLASPANYEGRTIAGVRYDPPVQPVAAPDLDRLKLFHTGEPLHLADVRDAIKRLYATGEYSDVEVDTEAAPQGVTVVVRTSEQWVVGAVEVRGKVKDPPNRGQLANAAQLELGAPFEDSQLQTATEGLRS